MRAARARCLAGNGLRAVSNERDLALVLQPPFRVGIASLLHGSGLKGARLHLARPSLNQHNSTFTILYSGSSMS